jgi:hypothetical protein
MSRSFFCRVAKYVVVGVNVVALWKEGMHGLVVLFIILLQISNVETLFIYHHHHLHHHPGIACTHIIGNQKIKNLMIFTAFEKTPSRGCTHIPQLHVPRVVVVVTACSRSFSRRVIAVVVFPLYSLLTLLLLIHVSSLNHIQGVEEESKLPQWLCPPRRVDAITLDANVSLAVVLPQLLGGVVVVVAMAMRMTIRHVVNRCV